MNLIEAFQKLNDLKRQNNFEDIISTEPSNTATYNNLVIFLKLLKI